MSIPAACLFRDAAVALALRGRAADPGKHHPSKREEPENPRPWARVRSVVWECYGWQFCRPPINTTNYAEWMRRLKKCQCMFYQRTVVISDNFKGHVMLISDWILPSHFFPGFLGDRL